MATDPTPATIIAAATLAEVQAAVAAHSRIRVRGGGSKPALSHPPAQSREPVTLIELAALHGVLDYEPAEYTFTARAATPAATVVKLLGQEGQYLPCDPVLAAHGATLGGLVATGTNGPGRYRYGGLRDFLLGVRFINGRGELISGGGRVVKNAAGFDFPKLMVGSLGRLGILVEVTFKVFPQPPAYATLQATYPDLASALQAQRSLSRAPLDLEALDLAPLHGTGAQEPLLYVRIGGLPATLPERLSRLRTLLQRGEEVPTAAEPALWHELRELAWAPAGWALARLPLTPHRIPGLEAALVRSSLRGHISRHYSVAGNLAWLAWPPAETPDLDALLAGLGLGALMLRGTAASPHLGTQVDHPFGRRIQSALDPEGRFLAI